MSKKSSKIMILETAEDLFSRNGFEGTSVDSIAKKANVNKALIYYYFENKEDILSSIFLNVQEELIEHLKTEISDNKLDLRNKLKNEIIYLRGKKNVISLILMESLKENQGNFLFKNAEIAIKNNQSCDDQNKRVSEKIYIKEFFTGFIPLLNYIAFEDKLCEYLNCSKDNAMNYFLESFISSHFK
jgi:AcrR family transcriptional regulator